MSIGTVGAVNALFSSTVSKPFSGNESFYRSCVSALLDVTWLDEDDCEGVDQEALSRFNDEFMLDSGSYLSACKDDERLPALEWLARVTEMPEPAGSTKAPALLHPPFDIPPPREKKPKKKKKKKEKKEEVPKEPKVTPSPVKPPPPKPPKPSGPPIAGARTRSALGNSGGPSGTQQVRTAPPKPSGDKPVAPQSSTRPEVKVETNFKSQSDASSNPNPPKNSKEKGKKGKKKEKDWGAPPNIEHAVLAHPHFAARRDGVIALFKQARGGRTDARASRLAHASERIQGNLKTYRFWLAHSSDQARRSLGMYLTMMLRRMGEGFDLKEPERFEAMFFTGVWPPKKPHEG